MTWELSDGTIIERGGRVTGGTATAQGLREHLDALREIAIGPEPSEPVVFSPNDSQLLDLAIRRFVGRPNRAWMMVRLVSSPAVEPLPPYQGRVREVDEERERDPRFPDLIVY